MAKMFNEEMAQFYEKYYTDKGVKFIKEDVATGFEGNGKVESKDCQDVLHVLPVPSSGTWPNAGWMLVREFSQHTEQATS